LDQLSGACWRLVRLLSPHKNSPRPVERGEGEKFNVQLEEPVFMSAGNIRRWYLESGNMT
jgi:hypothetical protein